MANLEVELDTYSLEQSIDGLGTNIEQLDTNLDDFTDAVKELAGLLRESAPKQASAPLWTPTGPAKKKTYGGFVEGDEVVFVGPLQPLGVRAVVDSEAWNADELSNVVPVKRSDNGEGDGFPAKNTILASALDTFKRYIGPDPLVGTQQPPEPLADDQPTGDELAWNLKTIQRAIDESRKVRFTYVKPAATHDPIWSSKRSDRLFAPRSLEALGPDGQLSIVKGRDISLDQERSFRLDRIDGYVRVVRD